MSEAKFTKGKWHTKPNERNESEIQVFYPHGFLTSASIIKIDDTRLNGESWLEMRERTRPLRDATKFESNANMYLIAAAPEMYDEIEREINYLIKLLQSLDRYSNDYLFYSSELERKQRLLSKARGES